MTKLFFVLFSLICFSTINAQTTGLNKSAGITLSLPLINQCSFYNYSDAAKSNQAGYLGGGFFLFYKRNKNKIAIGYEHPSMNKSLVPPKGGYSNIETNIFETTIHHKFREQFGAFAGLNYTVYHFHSWNDIPPFPQVDKWDRTLGLTAGAEFLPSNSTSVVISYRPSLFSFDKKSYRAIFSFALRYDINFWKN